MFFLKNIIEGDIMDSKAVVLAAGRGTRLLPITENMPKTLIKVQGTTLLEHILDRVVDAGLKEIVIVIGHCGNSIKNAIGEVYRGTPVTYIENPIYDQTNSTYSLWLAKEAVGDDFVVINADTVFNKNIIKYLVNSDYNIALAIDYSLTGELPEDNMKVTIVDGLIKDASKKIPPELTHGDAIGMYRFKGEGVEVLYKALDKLVEDNILDQLFTYAVKGIMADYDVHPVSTNGLAWIEIDDHKDLKDAEKVVSEILDQEKKE